MAINKNHLFEDLEGVKCAIVESGVSETRKDFLKSLLETNGYKVVVSAEIPKTAAPPADTETPQTPAPSTYKIGVTDVSFNSTNAIFGRLLKTKNGKVVTMAYWQQKEAVSHDDVPYFESGNN
ncbi:MAG TPA: hypothetical protein VFW78_08085 [Bacteroidia bacterium]|nr:hypothetical protein [Bacteroidia bacterium]